MLSLPDDWRFSIRGLATRARDGREAVAKGVQELREHGYLVTSYIRDEHGHIIENEYVLYEYSQIPDYYARKVKPKEQALKEVIHKDGNNSACQNPSTGNSTEMGEKTVCQNPSTGKSTEKSAKKAFVCQNPSTGNPYTENPSEPNNTCTNILN